MPRLTIDGAPVEAAPGATIFDAAAAAGIEIPALCHVRGVRPLTSCMLCVVKNVNQHRLLPSCSAPVEEGMIIETRCDEVNEARRHVLELLLSEHVGDCEAPCRQICPAFFDVSVMMRRIAAGDFAGASEIARDQLTLPATLGYVCSAPCEQGCHRAAQDTALLIRDMHRQIGEHALALPPPQTAPATGKFVAIVGAGAAGLAAAYVLLQRGHGCHLFDKADQIGRPVREYGEETLDPRALDAEIEVLRKMGAAFTLDYQVTQQALLANAFAEFHAILITCNDLGPESEKTFFAVEYPMAVNAVAEGKAAADQIDRYLHARPADRRNHPFNSRLGALRPSELDSFLTRTDPNQTPKRQLLKALIEMAYSLQSPKADTKREAHVAEDPQVEAARCLHCECLKPVSCRLRRYATDYGAGQTSFRLADRADVAPIQRFGEVAFEPGKCIKCGLCVEIGRQTGQPHGMSFVGRGYTVQVQPPFERSLADALTVDAARCVEVCPTGALAFRQGEPWQP